MATMGAGDVVVHLDGVTIGYDKNKPLAEIPSLKIKNGEILAIAGPSGIGKSTLVKTIAGLVRPLTGDIEVCGVMAPRRPVRGQLGYIPQRLGLIRHASVFHNVLIGSRAKFCGPLDFLASKQAKDWAKKAIEKMGLEHKTWEPIKRLSGGQQRRVATARTLAQRPKLILADEFLSELDEETMSKVADAVVEYSRQEGAAVVLIEHDISRARSIADRLVVMDDGRLNPFLSETKTLEVKL
ncbi:MAG: ATP-binding cassette domain-containing protein [Candidatus Thermoplasmatota archaeon]|nr:ATP-binding cassette domain-containing protein [Candidatus Thermoplasmatota archaeon]MED5303709.1 ATP-binding cassette domain-containing protein [Candidatus Thermoplasmatota archaeon]